jgi:hypothetical protein
MDVPLHFRVRTSIDDKDEGRLSVVNGKSELLTLVMAYTKQIQKGVNFLLLIVKGGCKLYTKSGG